jgi:hypothetical protein
MKQIYEEKTSALARKAAIMAGKPMENNHIRR